MINRRRLITSMGSLMLSGTVSRALGEEPFPEPPLHPEPYASARRSFRTHLLKRGPALDEILPLAAPPGAKGITYRSSSGSGELDLVAWVSPSADVLPRKPAVLFLHGGNALGDGHWDLLQPYIDAGYAVMLPSLRGENGQAGAFSGFYDEVDDVIAAAEVFAAMPGVDAGRMVIAGHSVGGTLTLLAAMVSSRFRMAVPMSGQPSAFAFFHRFPEDIRFDASNPLELDMRSAVCFPGSLKCPVHLLRARAETRNTSIYDFFVGRVKSAGGEIALGVEHGDHNSALDNEIPRSVTLFRSVIG